MAFVNKILINKYNLSYINPQLFLYEICLSSFIMSQVPVTLNSASIRSCSSWTWPWRQSRTESYLVNGAVIFISVLQRLYKSVPRPPPLRHLSGSQHAAGRPEALLWNHIPSSTEHGRCVTRRFSSMRELVCYLRCVFHHAGLQRAALAAFGQEIAHLQSRGQWPFQHGALWDGLKVSPCIHINHAILQQRCSSVQHLEAVRFLKTVSLKSLFARQGWIYLIKNIVTF